VSLESVQPKHDRDWDPEAPIFRFFDKEEYADQFAKGKVYLSTLEACRKYENTGRGDRGEASQQYQVGQRIDTNTDFADPLKQRIAAHLGFTMRPNQNVTLEIGSVGKELLNAYVLCFTSACNPNLMSEDFGKYCVEIKQPFFFLQFIGAYLNKTHPLNRSDFDKVRYREREFSGMEETPGALGFVKPVEYAGQKEVRMLFSCKDNANIKPFVLNVPQAKELCRRVI
jgi:hypothetical protein